MPDIIFLIYLLIIILLIARSSGIMSLLGSGSLISLDQTQRMGLLFRFFKYLIVFLVINFIAGTYLNAMRYGMIKDIILKKKITVKNGLIYATGYFWRLIWLRLLTYLIVAVSFIIITIVYLIISSLGIGITGGVVYLLLVSALLIVLYWHLMFRYPAMFFANKNPYDSLRDSFNYYNKNKKHVFKVFLIMLVVNLVINFIFSFKSGLIFSFVSVVMFFVVKLWNDLFLFNSYNVKKSKGN